MKFQTNHSGSIEYVRYNESLEKPEISFAFPAIPGYSGNRMKPENETAIHTSQQYLPPLEMIWIAGMAGIIIYGFNSYFNIKKRIQASLNIKENIWICDEISSAFLFGLRQPRIYLPSDLMEEDKKYVIAHENAHLQRRDHWWKSLAYLLLAVYWFHPLSWIAYILFCRDIELACDEKVCKQIGAENKKAYAEALLNCSMHQNILLADPLSFGEVGVKVRVKEVLYAKKQSFAQSIVAGILCLWIGMCFLTDPQRRDTLKWAQQLSKDEVASIDQIVHPDEKHRVIPKEEYDEITALIRLSQGYYQEQPEQIFGQTITFYITMKDGAKHTISNIGNEYLKIDEDYYRPYYWNDDWEESIQE